MRTYFAQVKTRYQAIKECPFTPSKIAKVYGGFMCFESTNDYKIWKNQKYPISPAGLICSRELFTNLNNKEYEFIKKNFI